MSIIGRRINNKLRIKSINKAIRWQIKTGLIERDTYIRYVDYIGRKFAH